MAITAREVVFFLRVENQASRAFRQVARDLGGLRNLKDVQNAAAKAQAANAIRLEKIQQRQVALQERYNLALERSATLSKRAALVGTGRASSEVKAVQQRILANQAAQLTAIPAANKAQRIFARGKASGGFTVEELGMRADAAAARVANLARQETLLNKILKETRSASMAAASGIKVEADAAASAVARLSVELAILQKEEEEVRLAGAATAAEFERVGKALPLERLSRMVSFVQRLGRVMQVSGVVIGATFAFAAHTAANFETQVSLAATQARQLDAPLASIAVKAKAINAEILKQMREFPATSQEMSDSFYQIFSGTNVQNVQKAAQMVHVFNQMAVAGGASLESMTQAGITIFNNFPGEFKNMTQAANVFFASVRYGRMTADQFAQALGYIAPIAKDAGLTFRQIAEDMAFFTRQTGGKMTRQDAQGLARLIQLLARDDVSKGLQKQGIAVFDSFGKMRSIVDILTDIHNKLKLTPQETLNFFKTISASGSGKSGTQGTIQAIRIFSQGINNGKAYLDVVNHVRHDQNEMIAAFGAQIKTPGVTWKVFTNQLKVLSITIGEQVIPALIQLGRPISKLINWFNDLSPGTKHAVAYFGTFGAAALILIGTLLSLGGALAHLIIAFRLMRLTGGAGGIFGIGAEAGAAAPEIALLLGAMGALYLLFIKYPAAGHEVMQVLGGLHGIVISLAAAIAYLAGSALIPKLVASFATMQAAAVAANTELTALKFTMLSLAKLGPIALVVTVTEIILHRGQIDKFVSGVLRGLGDKEGQINAAQLQKLASQPGVDPFARSGARDIIAKMQSDVKKITPRLKELKSLAKGGDDDAAKALRRYYNEASVLKHLYGTSIPMETVPKIARDRQKQVNELNKAIALQPRLSAQKAISAAANDKQFMKQLSNVARLQAAYEKAPNLKNFRSFTNAQAALTSKFSSDAYKGFASDYLSRVASDTKKAAKDIDKASSADLNKRIQAVLKLKKAYDMSHTLADGRAYFAAMTKLNNDYASTASQDYISNYIDRVNTADQKRLATMKQNIANAKSMVKDLATGVQGMYDTLLQQNQTNFGELFAGPTVAGARIQTMEQFGYKPTGGDLLKDLKSQMFQFTRFNRQINQLSKRGAPTSLLDQLRTMGPGAKDSIKALNNLSPAQWAAYIKAWQASQNAIKSATMRQLNSQLKTYEKHGKNIASAIIRGIRSQDTKLSNAIENIVLNMFPGLANQAHLHKSKGTTTVNNNTNQPKKVSENIHIHMHGKATAEDKAAVKQVVFRLQNGWFS